MGRRIGLTLLACAAALLLAGPAYAADFRVGAATTDVTPPAFNAANDAADLGPQGALCPASYFNGPRLFRYEEPYRDQNGNGVFDYQGDTFCDANGNGHWDGVYSAGAPDHVARAVKQDNRPVARAFAISDGAKTTIIVSVTAEGLHQTYTERMREQLLAQLPAAARANVSLVVSANHNESSPDTVGINGGLDPGIGAGTRSGIDDYYMDLFFVPQVAQAALDAYRAMRPANLYARQFPVPPGISVHLSNNWPTTDGIRGRDPNLQTAAIDPKIGLLQARGEDGKPIVTVMSLAAHNQEIGHSSDPTVNRTLSGDWPGYFERGLESRLGAGTGVFLVGDNGSEEDPQTVPSVPSSAAPGCPSGCFEQAKATGEAFASTIAREAPKAQRIRSGGIVADRKEFCAPLENSVFKAAAAAGIFGERQTYTCQGGQMVASGRTGNELKTEVNVVDVGPDLQLISNPGEAFPALMLGSPFGVEETPCASPDTLDRSNPAVPTWRGHATYRFQVGLANDIIGYEEPGWAYVDVAPVFPTSCSNDSNDVDSKGHQHKLETEGVGPTASNLVANQSAALLAQRPDRVAQVRLGRFVRGDGTLSRRAAGAVAVWLAAPGSTSLNPGTGSVVALAGIGGFGSRAVDRTGVFMDYDGADQAAPDITSRGMLTFACSGAVEARYYLDVFPALAAPSKIDSATTGAPNVGCAFPGGGGGATGGPGRPLGTPRVPPAAPGCHGRLVIASRVARHGVRVTRRRLFVRGVAGERGCRSARVSAVTVSISQRLAHGRCRFLQPDGHLSRPRSCRRQISLGVRGTRAWRLSAAIRLPAGRYRLVSIAYDVAARREHAGPHGDIVRFRVKSAAHRRSRPRR